MKFIDQLLALESEATQGEWVLDTDGERFILGDDNAVVCGYDHHRNAKFIVAMRNNIVALCEVAKAAEELVISTNQWNEAMVKIIGRQPDTGISCLEKTKQALVKLKEE